jgi:hypothetical protein
VNDSDEEQAKPGDTVLLMKIPLGFLDDLPVVDQRAVFDVGGTPVALKQYDEDGRAEVEFADHSGTIHFIYLSPDFITLAK